MPDVVHHGEAVNINVIDYMEAEDHHLDLPDAQVEEEEEVVDGASEFDQH